MTWPLAAVIIVGIVGMTIAVVAPMYYASRDARVHDAGVHDEVTQVHWPKRDEE